MKKLIKVCGLSSLLSLCVLGIWAAKPFPKDPAERAKALERYKQGLGLYAKGQKLQSDGKFDEANATYGQAMTLFQDGPKPDMANCYNRLGNAHLEKTPEKSLWYYSEALSIRRKDHGEEHEAVAASHNNAGTACMKMKEYDQAIARFVHLEIDKSFKKYPSWQAKSILEIGRVLLAQDKREEAVQRFKDILNHPVLGKEKAATVARQLLDQLRSG